MRRDVDPSPLPPVDLAVWSTLVETHCEPIVRVPRDVLARLIACAQALREARDMLDEWGAYADTYFKDKHDFTGDCARLDAALAGVTDTAPATGRETA